MNYDEVPTSFFEENGQIRYFSLARHALLTSLTLAGVVKGSRVLLPSFLCRDLLAPVNLIGATPCWYEVDHNLSPLRPPELWPSAEIVLMVNYFGFPQNIAPFEIYSEITGAKIIEDNAHGFLSRNEQGKLLGCRAEYGIFSIRKTLRIPDGAALWVKSSDNLKSIPEQLLFVGNGVNPQQLIKFRIRSTPMVGEFLYKLFLKYIRLLRIYILGRNRPADDSEFNLGISAEPWRGLPGTLINLDAQAEIRRRRTSYLMCSEECEKVGGIPVFSTLPNECVPYAYAFRGNQKAIFAMQKYANRYGFDMVNWPDLPGEIINQAPDYYRNIFLINLAW